MGTCWNKQNWFWGSKPKPAGILETKEGAWAGACSGTGRRQAPGWLTGPAVVPTAGECAVTWFITFQADPKADITHGWMIHPGRANQQLTQPAAFPWQPDSQPWSQCLGKHRAAPSTEQLNLALAASEHDSAYCTQPAFISLWPFYRLSAAFTGIWHIHFGLLHKVTLSRWTHCSWDVGNVLLSLLWAHTRTRDRTFCQPWVRIFNHFHNVCLQNWNTSRTKIKNCNCNRH